MSRPICHCVQCGREAPCTCGLLAGPVDKANNIADQAKKLVLGDRNQSYGSPAEDFARIAKTWSGLLTQKLKVDITAEEAILMMIALKLCREVHKPKHDTRVDIVGYALCADWVATGIRPEP